MVFDVVEQIVFFALGFALCGLIGLAFLPLVTARARRLTLALVEQRLPMSFDEIESERDILRAKFATENRALEIAADRARIEKAEVAAQVGRRAVEEMRMKEALEQKTTELLSRDGQIAELRAELERSQAQGAKAEADRLETQQRLATLEAQMRENSRDALANPEVAQALRAAIDDLGAKIEASPAAPH